jgi:hypothetical protein
MHAGFLLKCKEALAKSKELSPFASSVPLEDGFHPGSTRCFSFCFGILSVSPGVSLFFSPRLALETAPWQRKLSDRCASPPKGSSAEARFFRYIKEFSTAPDTAGPEKQVLLK